MNRHLLILTSALAAACSGAPIGGEARTLALNGEGLHLDVSATPGSTLQVGDKLVELPSGKARVVVPLAALPEGSSMTLPLTRKRLVVMTDRAPIVASIPYDPRLAATLPKADEPGWVRWLRAQGGTASKLGVMRDGERKLPIRLDDEGDCQLEFASTKGLVLQIGDGELTADPVFGGGKLRCSRLLERASFEFRQEGDREWLDVPVNTKDGRPVTRFSIDRDTAEEFLQKRVNRMIAQKTPFGGPAPGAQRVLYRDSERKLHFSGPISPIDLFAITSIKEERPAPECTGFTLEGKLETPNAPKTLKRLFIDVNVALYDRTGRQLGSATFPGGAVGCPPKVTPRTIGQTVRDGADRAAIDKWIARYVHNSGGVDLRSEVK